MQQARYVKTVYNFDFVNYNSDLFRVSVIFFCFVFNFSIVQVLFRLSEKYQLISVLRKVSVMFSPLCFPIDLSNLSITFPSSVKHYTFTPDFSDSPIFRTSLRFHWRFEKSGFHVTAIVSHVLLNQQQIDLRYNFTVNFTGNMVKYDSSPIYLRKIFST